jgi:hypothetical protein
MTATAYSATSCTLAPCAAWTLHTCVPPFRIKPGGSAGWLGRTRVCPIRIDPVASSYRAMAVWGRYPVPEGAGAVATFEVKAVCSLIVFNSVFNVLANRGNVPPTPRSSSASG